MMTRIRLFLVVGGYIGTLLWAYATIVSPAFDYLGCKLAWRDPVVMAWLIALALLPVSLLPCTLTRPSAIILWWLYLVAYIPSILMPALSLTMPTERLLPLQLSLLLCMGLLCFASPERLLAVSRIQISPAVFWSVFTVVWLGCLAFILKFGPDLIGNIASVLSGQSEYIIRSIFSDQSAQSGPALGYVVGQVGQALGPYLMAFGIAYRRWLCVVAGIFSQIIVFGATGYKSVMFAPLLLGLLFLVVRRWRRSFGLVLTSGLIAVTLLCAAADLASHRVLYSSLFTRRTLAVPGLLTGFYFEHYSQAAHAGIGYHFIRTGPVPAPPYEIGLTYFRSEKIDANANLWAEGFADFGVPGMVGYTLLVAFLIWIYDSIAVRHDLALATLLAAIPGFNLSNSMPTTVLLTHGGIAAALLLYLSPPRKLGGTFELALEPEQNQLVPVAGTPV
jgi:hypothetical protein